MEKKLKKRNKINIELVKDGNIYKLLGKDCNNNTISISIIDNKIDGKEIYDQIYRSNFNIVNNLHIEISSKLTEKKDEILLKQIKDVFLEIEKHLESLSLQ